VIGTLIIKYYINKIIKLKIISIWIIYKNLFVTLVNVVSIQNKRLDSAYTPPYVYLCKLYILFFSLNCTLYVFACHLKKMNTISLKSRCHEKHNLNKDGHSKLDVLFHLNRFLNLFTISKKLCLNIFNFSIDQLFSYSRTINLDNKVVFPLHLMI
jgi:hypothetical protein